MAVTDIALTATVSGAGTAVITVTPRNRQTWTVTQVSPEMANAPGVTVGVIRKNGFLVSPFVAQADAVAGDPPVVLRLGDRLTIEWSGATPGLVGRALVTYDDGVY